MVSTEYHQMEQEYIYNFCNICFCPLLYITEALIPTKIKKKTVKYLSCVPLLVIQKDFLMIKLCKYRNVEYECKQYACAQYKKRANLVLL